MPEMWVRCPGVMTRVKVTGVPRAGLWDMGSPSGCLAQRAATMMPPHEVPVPDAVHGTYGITEERPDLPRVEKEAANSPAPVIGNIAGVEPETTVRPPLLAGRPAMPECSRGESQDGAFGSAASASRRCPVSTTSSRGPRLPDRG